MSNHLQTIHLDPLEHRDGVNGFFDYYGLPSKKPELDYLQGILYHFAKIPYENISKIIKLSENWDSNSNKIRLPEEVIEKHISSRLGGTCFSLTFFLQSILTQNGFTCYPVMADMRAGRNIHCCLIVILDSVKYLVDPGYLLTQPMKINPQNPRLFRNEFSGVELRYDSRNAIYNLLTFNKNESKWRYRFRDRAVPSKEFSQHWLASFSWNSMHGICLTKVMNEGLLYIHKNFMRETTFDGKRNFNIKRNYHSVIHENFGIDKQFVEQAQAALQDNLEREKELGLWVPKKKSLKETKFIHHWRNIMETAINEIKLKKLIKEAVEEVLVENKELLSNLILEAVEDIALIKAIKEGDDSQTVSREEIFKILNAEK